jgi:hypothetical protein
VPPDHRGRRRGRRQEAAREAAGSWTPRP